MLLGADAGVASPLQRGATAFDTCARLPAEDRSTRTRTSFPVPRRTHMNMHTTFIVHY